MDWGDFFSGLANLGTSITNDVIKGSAPSPPAVVTTPAGTIVSGSGGQLLTLPSNSFSLTSGNLLFVGLIAVLALLLFRAIAK